ncbi:PAS domain-containing protein [Arthrobacter sp. MDT1-48-3]
MTSTASSSQETPDSPAHASGVGAHSVEAIEYFVNCPTGIVEHYFESRALHWSDELYRIHGYERGEIVPTLDLGVSHFEPADKDAARSLWESLLSQGGPRSAYLSLRDVTGKARKWIRQRSQLTNRKVIAISQDIIDRTHQLNQQSRPELLARALLDLLPTP